MISAHTVNLTRRIGLLGRCVGGLVLSFMAHGAQAQAVSVSEGGVPSYSLQIAVPPGIAGMTPNIALIYSGSSVNGPVGYGWTVQGISMITRCPGDKLIDGYAQPVSYSVNDKLCLDGQRLIQTDASGTVVNAAVTSPGIDNPFQQNDSLGGTGLVREYRTEKDIYARIRGYGTAGGDPANGPAYFQVWTKSGQIFEYGVNSNTTANAQIVASGRSLVVAWPVSRISDTVGNYIDFQYEQRDVAWGSGVVAGSPTTGHEWNLLEIRYTGNGAQLPVNKVVFDYGDRPDTPGAAQDRGEAYHQGSKNVSVRLLSKVTTYINWSADQATKPAGAVKVKTIKLTYDNGPISQRSRLRQLVECAGAAETACLPPTTFNYAAGGDVTFTPNAAFTSSGLSTLLMQSTTGSYSVFTGNFFGSGRTDFIRWSDSPGENQLYRSIGDGTFEAMSTFNITDQNLFRSDGCYTSIAGDFNGDGKTDILRVMQATSTSTSASCGTVRNILYLSNGNGSFSASDVTGIDFTQLVAVDTTRYNCLTSNDKAIYVPNCMEPGDINLGTEQGLGQNYHVLDVNNDGILDIITTIRPHSPPSTTPPSDATACASIVCTHVYLGQTNGQFVESTTTNLTHQSVYADPPTSRWMAQFMKFPYVGDVDGDGVSDLIVKSGVWLSRGNGNFVFTQNALSSMGCIYPLDFNGDGRADCMFLYSPFGDVSYRQWLSLSDGTTTLKKAANFNLVSSGQELYGFSDALAQYQSIGMQAGDFDGDGRTDILRWEDDPTQNALYLSNGDGTFRTAAFNLTTADDQLQKSDGTASFVLGDFTGHGNMEILRLVANPTGASGATRNQLYVKTTSTPPDQLQSVTTGTGLTTTLTWVPLSNSSSGGLGERYASDSGTANAAVYPVVDLTLPMYVVATSTADTGAGGTQSTEYSYSGLKTANDGRGWIGFRETRHQSLAPDLSNLTVHTLYLLDAGYVGMASMSETWLGALNVSSSQVLSRSTYVYCDKTSASGAEAAATSTAPCPVSAKVQRPYLYMSTEEGWDLDGAVLPKVTTVNTFNNSGDPTQIAVTTSGTALGVAQTFTKTTNNQYNADNTAGDRWILGRLQQASVSNSVPDMSALSTSAGSAPSAAANQGQTLSVGISPTSLTVVPAALGAASGVLTANVSGGAAPYTYSWARTAGSRAAISSSAAVSPTLSATVAASDNFTETWAVTVTDDGGATATASANVTFTAPAVLVLSACTSTTPTTAPTVATTTCTLSNSGQTPTASISYSTVSGTTVSGPTGVCAVGAVCGTVTVTTSATAGNYAGTLKAIPNVGVAASAAINLTVNTPPPAALVLSGCTSTTPSTAPAPATTTCTLSNSGQTATTSIAYSAISGASVSGPTGVCGVGAVCGTVTVTTSTSPGNYAGTLTATPNAGSSASTAINLTVNPGVTTLTSSPTTLAFGTVSKGTLKQLSVTITNAGPYVASGISYVVSGRGDPGNYLNAGGTCSSTLGAGASCTVIVGYDAGCTGGGVSGSLTIAGSIFTSVVTSMTASTNKSGVCP